MLVPRAATPKRMVDAVGDGAVKVCWLIRALRRECAEQRHVQPSRGQAWEATIARLEHTLMLAAPRSKPRTMMDVDEGK